ncbi:outer membrane receptor protein [Sporocytophaga myxococcoides]|uniref:Outer membrane receptor protein n=2 Tax=Sporocytophaga myxococcoides TaxID=153721 RepID=A0A098L9C2_9BACT|nr:outer membrane receptor protein [Sporocytophaga myxococcoides]
MSSGQEILRGKVIDKQTKSPLSGANIFIKSQTVASTDELGQFEVACKDSLKITASYIGYQDYQLNVVSCQDVLIELVQSDSHLKEIEISATSNANKAILNQPQSIVKLNETELKRGTGLFLDDAINTNVPGVYMERRTVSAGQQFNIRGYGNGARGTNGINSNFDTQGSKVYLNNIPITDAEGITLMDDIDFGSVSNVEVVKGPSGSLYGLAIAGVVNLQTKKAEKGKTSVSQIAMLGSYGLQRYTTSLEIGGERSSLLINYGKQKSDGFMAHSASQKDFVNVMGDFNLNARQGITAYFGYSNSYDERGGELTIEQYKNRDYSGNKAYIKNNAHSEIISFRAGIGHLYRIKRNISNNTTVFGSGMNSNASSAGGWTDKRPVNYGFRSTFDTRFALGSKISLSGITGIEFQSQHAQIIGYGMVADSFNLSGYNIIGPQRSNQSTITSTSSLFSEWTLTLPHDISLTAGVGWSTMNIRLDDRNYLALNNNPSNTKAKHVPTSYKASYTDMVSPKFAFNKVFSRQISVYASYSKGYKAPVSSYFYIPTTGELNLGLKPEIGTQFEIGSKGNLLDERLQFQVVAFNTIFSNKMTTVAVQNPANTATLYTYLVNSGSLNNKGLEVMLIYTAYQSKNAAFTSVRPFANFTYSHFRYDNIQYQSVAKTKTNKDSLVTVDYSGNAVAGVPPVTLNAGIDFLTKYGVYGNVNYSYRDQMPFTSDGNNKAEGYSLLNAKVGYQHKFFDHLNVGVYFGANNITSTQYYYMVFLNQLPDAYLPAPYKINYFGGLNLKYSF